MFSLEMSRSRNPWRNPRGKFCHSLLEEKKFPQARKILYLLYYKQPNLQLSLVGNWKKTVKSTLWPRVLSEYNCHLFPLRILLNFLNTIVWLAQWFMIFISFFIFLKGDKKCPVRKRLIVLIISHRLSPNDMNFFILFQLKE